MNINDRNIDSVNAYHNNANDRLTPLQQIKKSMFGKAGKAVQTSQLPATNRYNATQQSSTPEQAKVSTTMKSNNKGSRSILNFMKNTRSDPNASSSGSSTNTHSLLRQNARREHTELNAMYNELLNSVKASRSDPVPVSPPAVPKRLQQKADAINLPKLKKLNTDLYKYAKSTINAVIQSDGARAETNRQDKMMLPLLVDTENARIPGLNLHAYKTAAECYSAIKDTQRQVNQSGQPLNMRAIYPPFRGMPDHHIALDIKLTPRHSPSIVAFESSPVFAPQIKQNIADELHTKKVNIANLAVQNSQWDCVMFSLSIAKKFHKHSDDYTARLHNGEKRVPAPADFFKHAQSKTLVSALSVKDDVVTKDKAGPHAETLMHRSLAYRADRVNRSYSTSIEGFRLQEIMRAGEFLAQMKR